MFFHMILLMHTVNSRNTRTWRQTNNPMIPLLPFVHFAGPIFQLVSGSMEHPVLRTVIMVIIHMKRMMHVNFESCRQWVWLCGFMEMLMLWQYGYKVRRSRRMKLSSHFHRACTRSTCTQWSAASVLGQLTVTDERG